MKIKTKLTFGVGLLFILIFILSGISAWYINDLKGDTENILVSNYNTLQYARNMILALDEMGENKEASKAFEANLDKQQKNETEAGEHEVTGRIAERYSELKSQPDNVAIIPGIRKDVAELMRLNMEAIERKSRVAKHTAETATIWIITTGTLCFLIAFLLLVNLPGSIADPIRELTESIRQIAQQKYVQRVHFESHNEFGELARSFNTMAQKLEEYADSKLDKILKEKKRIETLINNMRDPVIGIDEHNEVLFANNEALKITGLSQTEFIGRKIPDIAAANDLVRSLIQELMEPDHMALPKQPMKIYADGKESFFEKEMVNINIVPTGEQEEQFIGYVILLRNITPFKELDYAKTNFIATVSHELKTPIASVKMSVQLLEDIRTGALNGEQQLLVESIKEDSDRLLKITGELLNMAQVETGNIQLNIKAGSPYTIMQYAIDATRSQVEKSDTALSILAEEGLPEVLADADKTAWVLTNFITNAIRHSPKGGNITIRLRRHERTVVFAVEDSGSGIDQRYREKIFDRYFQVPGSTKSGSGLGLAICREFVMAQGGNIGLQTAPGQGSVFWFDLKIPAWPE